MDPAGEHTAMRTLRWLGLIALLALLAGCPKTQTTDGPCSDLGAVQVRAPEHTTWRCMYPDGDPNHLRWVKQSG